MTTGNSDDDKPTSATLLDQMGGWRGLVQSTLPVGVFVPVNAIFGMSPAIGAALGAALAILIWCLFKRQSVQPAISGFLGVALCGFIAYRSGEARDYYLFGLYTSLIYGAVLALSVLVRFPLVGVIWNLLNGRDGTWRRVPAARRAYDIATLVWVAVFAARYLVQSGLYDDDRVGWLGVARIAMGYPLAAVALVVCIWAVRRADRALAAVAEQQTETSDNAAADAAETVGVTGTIAASDSGTSEVSEPPAPGHGRDDNRG